MSKDEFMSSEQVYLHVIGDLESFSRGSRPSTLESNLDRAWLYLNSRGSGFNISGASDYATRVLRNIQELAAIRAKRIERTIHDANRSLAFESAGYRVVVHYRCTSSIVYIFKQRIASMPFHSVSIVVKVCC